MAARWLAGHIGNKVSAIITPDIMVHLVFTCHNARVSDFTYFSKSQRSKFTIVTINRDIRYYLTYGFDGLESVSKYHDELKHI
jgi:hypothetical protein